MYNIAEWNVNFAATKQTINNFLLGELLRLETDILVLTEFVMDGNEAAVQQIADQKGWAYLSTHNYTEDDPQNDVLIAWDNTKFELINDYPVFSQSPTRSDNNYPNLLAVRLKERNTLKHFLLIGTRITMGSQDQKTAEKLRRGQFEKIIALDKLISDEKPVLVVGDFNNYRRRYESPYLESWDLEAFLGLSAAREFRAYVPDGSSIYQSGALDDVQFPHDRFLMKGLEVYDAMYDRSFTSRCPEVYTHGQNFSVYDPSYDPRNRPVVWRVPCGSGYPDHAILWGEFCLD